MTISRFSAETRHGAGFFFPVTQGEAMDLDALTKLGSAITGAIIALLLAAWRLSRIWTRMEASITACTSGVAATATALDRVEETVHGKDGQNGLKSVCAQMAERTAMTAKRMDAMEKRMNAWNRRNPPRKGGRRGSDPR